MSENSYNKRIVCMLLLFAVMFLCSCSSLKPIAKSVSSPDYNQRVTVKEPHIQKHANAIGWTFKIALPVAGAYGGYSLPLVRKITEDGRQDNMVASTLFGAMAGMGASYLVDRIAGYNENIPNTDIGKWTRLASNGYILLKYDGNVAVLIDRSAESSFIVKDFADVNDFVTAFPNSSYSDQVFDQAIKVLTRNQIPELLAAMPGCKSEHQAILRYINESQTFQDLTDALEKYPVEDVDVEAQYLRRIMNPKDALLFVQKFPKTENKKVALVRAMSRTSDMTQELTTLQNVLGDDFNLSARDFSGSNELARLTYYRYLVQTSKVNNITDYNKFNDKYSWLVYSGKDQDLLSNAWDILDSKCKTEKEVMTGLRNILIKQYSKAAGLTDTSIMEFMKGKLAEIVPKNVAILSTNIVQSSNPDFERWKDAAYTAGIVTSEEGLKVLVWGKVRNNSKYELPVEFNVSGNIVSKVELGGFLGSFANLAGRIIDSPTSVSQELTRINTAEGYCIPALKPGETDIYACLLDFGDHTVGGLTTKSFGLNLGDLVKVSNEMSFTDVEVSVKFNDKQLTDYQIEKMAEARQFAINGLPSSSLTDILRNKKFDQNTWDDDWKRFLTAVSKSNPERHEKIEVVGIDESKTVWPSEKERLASLVGYELGGYKEDTDYVLKGGMIYLTNGSSYDWRIIYRDGKPFSYDFDPGLFSFWNENSTYEEMLESIVEYDSSK